MTKAELKELKRQAREISQQTIFGVGTIYVLLMKYKISRGYMLLACRLAAEHNVLPELFVQFAQRRDTAGQ